MSTNKIFLTKSEQHFLMDMLELKSPSEAVERFAEIIAEAGGDPVKLRDYLAVCIKKWDELP